MAKGTVCVTGAGGFIGSWTVQLLLSKGYIVHGTVRDPSDDAKNGHLKKLENAENLKLFKADLLDYEGLSAAIKGCEGVFHVASPLPHGSVSDPQAEIIEPAVKGSLNVLKASSEANVKRVIYVSSAGAVFMNPNWPKDKIMDETCWSDPEYCTQVKHWYILSKTLAESEARDYAEKTGLDVIRVCPMVVWGPVLQNSKNASSLLLLGVVQDGFEKMKDNVFLSFVDARDVAEALLLLYEKPEANGRYICTSYNINSEDLEDTISKVYPKYTQKYKPGKEEFSISSERLQKLGWRYRTLEDTIIDSIESYKKVGLLD